MVYLQGHCPPTIRARGLTKLQYLIYIVLSFISRDKEKSLNTKVLNKKVLNEKEAAVLLR